MNYLIIDKYLHKAFRFVSKLRGSGLPKSSSKSACKIIVCTYFEGIYYVILRMLQWLTLMLKKYKLKL